MTESHSANATVACLVTAYGAEPIWVKRPAADAVIAAIDREQFLILPHPEVLTFFQRKALDYERWLAGMRRLQARVETGGDE